MLTRLEPRHFSAVKALFDSMSHHLAVAAVLKGSVPGAVFADSVHRPRTAVAWVQQRLFLAGAPPASGWHAAFTDSIGPAARARGVRHLALYYAPTEWAALITAQLASLAPHAAQRHYYELRWPRRHGGARLPEGYALRSVNRDLLEEAGLAQLDALREELCSERPSVEDFLRHSFGVCVVKDDELAGWCLSEYNHAGACEVGIETLPRHRRLGLATVMATSLAERAHAAGIDRIGWHCYAQNAASVATALAAGFDKVMEYPAFVLDLEAGR